MDDRFETGIRVFGEMAGEDRAESLRALATSSTFGAGYYRIATGLAFGEVWSRPGLSRRERSLLTLGAAVEMRDTRPIREHIAIALNHGLTTANLEEALIQLIPYSGLPAVATAFEIAATIVAEREK